MQYNFEQYEKYKKSLYREKQSMIDSHLFDDMFNELALKPKCELINIISYLKDGWGALGFVKMTSSSYIKSQGNKLTPDGQKLLKLSETLHKILMHYKYGTLKIGTATKNAKIISEYLPVMKKHLGVIFDNNLKRAAFTASINQNYKQYTNEIELILASDATPKERVPPYFDNLFGKNPDICKKILWDNFDNVRNGFTPFIISKRYFFEDIIDDKQKLKEFIVRCNINETINAAFLSHLDIGSRWPETYNFEGEDILNNILEYVKTIPQDKIKLGLLVFTLKVITYLEKIDTKLNLELVNAFNLKHPETLNKLAIYLENVEKNTQHNSDLYYSYENQAIQLIVPTIKFMLIKAQQKIPNIMSPIFSSKIKVSNFNSEILKNAWGVATNQDKLAVVYDLLLRVKSSYSLEDTNKIFKPFNLHSVRSYDNSFPFPDVGGYWHSKDEEIFNTFFDLISNDQSFKENNKTILENIPEDYLKDVVDLNFDNLCCLLFLKLKLNNGVEHHLDKIPLIAENVNEIYL